MDAVEEARRVVRGYRQGAPRRTPPGLLDKIGKLDTELGPGRNMHLPAGGNLEAGLRDVASKLIAEGGVSNVAGTLLHGILAQLQTPGRRSAPVIDAQPNHAGQLPEPASAGNFAARS